MLRIEKAREPDVPMILQFIRGLAEYERSEDRVTATEDRLRESLFGKEPLANAILVYDDQEAVAFAVYYFSYSTFSATPGLYLEDIFVRPSHRRAGVGQHLFSYLAKEALAHRCSRLELSVLNWNQHAIDFYKKIGAQAVNEWTVFKLSEDRLQELASDATGDS